MSARDKTAVSAVTAPSPETPHEEAPLIEVRNLTKIYGQGASEVRALEGVSFSIYRGEMVAIMGPSGSGKSTLMHLLGCLDHPTSGSYRLDGTEVAGLTGDQRAAIRNRRIGFVFQSFNLLARASAAENVELPLIYSGTSNEQRQARARELLERVGLGGRMRHRPNELSGGQQQRVAIARALANDAPLIMADEPTGNLDSASSAEIMALFRSLNRDHGITVIVVTHALEVAAWCDRILSIRDGKLVEDRPASEVVPAAVLKAVSRAVTQKEAMA